MKELREQLSLGEPVSYQSRMRRGTIINSTHAPLPDGGWVVTHKDVTLQVRAAERSEYVSRHDPLTGLANRLAFGARLKDIKTKAVEANTVALLLIDLDRFKHVNDTYGHQTGDLVLAHAAKRLRACVGQSDLVARLGGDEFACVVERDMSLTRKVSQDLAAKIIDALKEPFDIAGTSIEIGASIGLSLCPSRLCEAETLVRDADKALYRVKEARRGDCSLFGQTVDAELSGASLV